MSTRRQSFWKWNLIIYTTAFHRLKCKKWSNCYFLFKDNLYYFNLTVIFSLDHCFDCYNDTVLTKWTAEIWQHGDIVTRNSKGQETWIKPNLLGKKTKSNSKSVTQTVVNTHHSLQSNVLVLLWPTVLAIIVCAHNFAVQWGIITNISGAQLTVIVGPSGLFLMSLNSKISAMTLVSTVLCKKWWPKLQK